MNIISTLKVKSIAFACILLAGLSLPANAEVRWLDKSFDFGLFPEAGGPRSGSVRFVNLGPEEAVVVGARATCGCTSVEYPHDPIAPGDTAAISFTYDPTGRPGRFEKHIRVYLADKPMTSITIRGNVLGTPQSLSHLYPAEFGPLRASTDVLYAGDIPAAATRLLFLNLYNQSNDPLTLTISSSSPAISLTSALAYGETVSSPNGKTDSSQTNSTQAQLPSGEILTLAITLNTRLLHPDGPASQTGEPQPFTLPIEIKIGDKAPITVPLRLALLPAQTKNRTKP